MKRKTIKSRIVASLGKQAKKNLINDEDGKSKKAVDKRVEGEINEDSEVSNDENGEICNEKKSVDSNEENSDVPSEEDSEDDTPTEAAIEKTEPTLPSKVKSGPIAVDFPREQIIHLNKLPKKCKVIDIVEVFVKYGPIDTVHIQEGTTNDTANVAFKSAAAATAALAAHKKAVIKGETILVKMKPISAKKFKSKLDNPGVNDSRDRSIHIKFLKRGTTEDELRAHFSSCGDIECVRIVLKNSITYAFVTFMDKSSVKEAMTRHNSVLNGNNIGVFENTSDGASNIGNRDPKLTIMLKNGQNLECVEGQILQSIFSKCGDVDSMDIVCKKNALAFITFKTEEAVAKAFKLNGKSLKGITLEVVAYNQHKPKTSIFITNLATDVTEDDIRAHFSKSGDISSVILKKGFAIIHFKDSSGYCNSFLLNETILNGKILFLEPHSIKKQAVMKSKYHYEKKRPTQIRNDYIDSKRVKTT